MAERLLYLWRLGRSLLLGALFAMAAEVVMLFTPTDKRAEKYRSLTRVLARLILRGNHISIEGESNIPSDQGVILAANHQSSFDIPLLTALIPVPFRWMSKHELFDAPFIGRSLRRTGAIRIVRGSKGKTRRAIRKTIDLLKNGENILIFPEGTWGDKSGRMRPFKRGIGALAKGAGVSVVPVTIIGTAKINPPDTLLINPGKAKLIVHPPMAPDEWDEQTDEAALQKLREVIGAPLEFGTQPARIIDSSK